MRDSLRANALQQHGKIRRSRRRRHQDRGKLEAQGVGQHAVAYESLLLCGVVVGNLEGGNWASNRPVLLRLLQRLHKRRRIDLNRRGHTALRGFIALGVAPHGQQVAGHFVVSGQGLLLDVGEQASERGRGIDGSDGRKFCRGERAAIAHPLQFVGCVVSKTQRRIGLRESSQRVGDGLPRPDGRGHGFVAHQASPHAENVCDAGRQGGLHLLLHGSEQAGE